MEWCRDETPSVLREHLGFFIWTHTWTFCYILTSEQYGYDFRGVNVIAIKKKPVIINELYPMI